MTHEQRHRRMNAARAHAQLSVQDVWLRYLALGGSCDAFDIDGYLQGLVPLEVFQQDVLAQALNEALDDSYRSFRVPLSTPQLDGVGNDRLRRLVDLLLDKQPPAPASESEPPECGSA